MLPNSSENHPRLQTDDAAGQDQPNPIARHVDKSGPPASLSPASRRSQSAQPAHTREKTQSAFSPTGFLEDISDTSLNSCHYQQLGHSTPCEPADHNGSPTSSYPRDEVRESVYIHFQHPDCSQVWETQSEASLLETSTPSYKRGNHEKDDGNGPIRDLILAEGMRYEVPTWQHTRRPTSVQMFVDHQLGEWPIGDTYVKLNYFMHQPVSQWIAKVKNHTIPIIARIIVLFIHKLRGSTHHSPLKNRISQIVRAIRVVAPDTHVFVCDMLPTESILDTQQILRFNRSLFTATQQANRETGKIFYLSMCAHFRDSSGNPIEPWDQYFKTSGELTSLGCHLFRSCLIREVGITNYSL